MSKARKVTGFDMMVAMAVKNYLELKQAQRSGGDTLVLRSYSQILTVAPNTSTETIYSIIMSPADAVAENVTMPLQARLIPADANSYNVGWIDRFYRTDNKFEFRATIKPNFGETNINARFHLVYNGKAKFEVTKLT